MSFETNTHHAPLPRPRMSNGVQVLSLILFTGFAIPVTIVMMSEFWPAGFALAVIVTMAWRNFSPAGGSNISKQDIENMVKDLVPSTKKHSSGNASFDAYRHDMMARLEAEQENFESFLSRLRDAKDKVEFDQFMDDRARVTHQDDRPALDAS